YSTLYAHLSRIDVSEGQEVASGDRIGAIGSTGWSTGPHLHFELRIDGRAVDPTPYLP
ncbi:MAG: M23 family metallopeptidase, partial [Acidimicrobiaceae bacterium]|nr:M23 family metallopeptidase [Acidimicrobiaceae bacterium]